MQGVFLDECMFWMDMPIMFRKVMKKTEYLSGTEKLLFFLKYRGENNKGHSTWKLDSLCANFF